MMYNKHVERREQERRQGAPRGAGLRPAGGIRNILPGLPSANPHSVHMRREGGAQTASRFPETETASNAAGHINYDARANNNNDR